MKTIMATILMPKKQKTGGDDRISALPDGLIHHILSFLLPSHTVRTSVLSSRWTNLWTSVPRLAFNYSGIKRSDRLYLSIDKTLLQYSSKKVQGVSFAFRYDPNCRDLDPHITVWLRWAIQHDASEISLELSDQQKPGSDYLLPQFLFSNSSLTKLNTRFCVYAPKNLVVWGSLSSLSIGKIELSSDALQRILLGSPVLESLELHDCSGLAGVDVSSSRKLRSLSLKKCLPLRYVVIDSGNMLENLVLENIQEGAMMEMNCPRLKTLKISGSWGRRLCRTLDFPSLINACLTYEIGIASEEDYFDLVEVEMVSKINHARAITLGPWIIQALSVLELKGSPSPFTNMNCQRLTLHTRFNERTLFAMKSLLESLPSLHTLVLVMSKDDTGEAFLPNSDSIPKDVFGENYQLSVSCLCKHLKTFEIVRLDPNADQSHLLKFTRFLLRKARVLEKMEVSWAKNASCRRISEVQRKLLFLPRSSSHAIVLA